MRDTDIQTDIEGERQWRQSNIHREPRTQSAKCRERARERETGGEKEQRTDIEHSR